MKTPRDVLLECHRATTPKLDALRRRLLETELNAAARAPSGLLAFLRQAWHELFWSCRPVWGGLAAVWAMIVALNWIAAERQPVHRPLTTVRVTTFDYVFLSQKLQSQLEESDVSVRPRPVIQPPPVQSPRSERHPVNATDSRLC